MITIERRYQHWATGGIKWTKWYVHKQYNTMEEALKEFPSISKRMESKTLKAEYRIGNNNN